LLKHLALVNSKQHMYSCIRETNKNILHKPQRQLDVVTHQWQLEQFAPKC